MHYMIIFYLTLIAEEVSLQEQIFSWLSFHGDLRSISANSGILLPEGAPHWTPLQCNLTTDNAITINYSRCYLYFKRNENIVLRLATTKIRFLYLSCFYISFGLGPCCVLWTKHCYWWQTCGTWHSVPAPRRNTPCFPWKEHILV